jgi:hypothetical protein
VGRRWLGLSIGSLLLACAGSGQVHESTTSTRVASSAERRARLPKIAPLPKSSLPAKQVARVEHEEGDEGSRSSLEEIDERDLVVHGIEGTMSEYDVRATLEEHSQEFDRCHDAERGGGRVVFGIRILRSGAVGDVNVRGSSVRNRDLVDCYAGVIASTTFPSPHGDYADVKWTTKVGRARQKKDELFERKVRWDAPSVSEQSRSSRAESRRQRRSRRHRDDG